MQDSVIQKSDTKKEPVVILSINNINLSNTKLSSKYPILMEVSIIKNVLAVVSQQWFHTTVGQQ